MSTKVVARVPFKYAGNVLDRGELTELKGSPRDEKLLGLKYFILFDPKIHTPQRCDTCTRMFISESALIGHKKKPTCFSDQSDLQPISTFETAEMVGADPTKFKMES